MEDALARRLSKVAVPFEEEDTEYARYLLEAEAKNIVPESPRLYFRLPQEWTPSKNMTQAYESMTGFEGGDTNTFQERSAAQGAVGESPRGS